MSEYIVEAESRADLVDGHWYGGLELVRCGECKYHEYYEGHHSCEWHGFADVKEDWYCADGERKDDEIDS